MQTPAECLAGMNKLLWTCVGHPEMDSLYRSIGNLAAAMATRGWLRTIHKDWALGPLDFGKLLPLVGTMFAPRKAQERHFDNQSWPQGQR